MGCMKTGHRPDVKHRLQLAEPRGAAATEKQSHSCLLITAGTTANYVVVPHRPKGDYAKMPPKINDTI